MQTLDFTLTGDVNVGIRITQNDDGTLTFDLRVLDDTGSIGDLNGIFFDVADGSLLDGLSFAGDDITGTAVKEDGVTKVDGYMNVNGEVANEYGKFDAGVQFGTSGIAVDDIRETSFTLSHDSVDLTLDMFSVMDFAARLTSVGEEDGTREDSLKLGGTAPEVIDEPTGPVNIANDDTMTVSSVETFSDFGLSDPLDNFVFSVLENDTSDGAAYTGGLTTVDGQPIDDFVILEGSNGGQLQLNADGTVDFSANGDFDTLQDAETAQTQFTYGVEGGDPATITVEVFAFDGGGGPIGEFDPFA